jgi:hypothetical protein
MMQAGDYWGVITGAETSELDNAKRTPLMYVKVLISHVAGVDGNGAPAWVPLEQQAERDMRFFLTEKAWPHTEKKLRGLGFNGDFENPQFGDKAIADGVKLVCTHQAGNGADQTLYENWDLAEWGERKERQPASKDTVRKFAALWRTGSSAAAKPAGGPPAMSAPPPAQPKAPTAIEEQAAIVSAAMRAQGPEGFMPSDVAEDEVPI